MPCQKRTDIHELLNVYKSTGETTKSLDYRTALYFMIISQWRTRRILGYGK
jgi:hypothetical protein